MSLLIDYLPLAIVLVVCGVGLALAHVLLLARHKELGSEEKLPRQLVLLALTFMALILAIIAAPMADSTRDQILSLLGIALSAAIAFSSTSFVTNFMAAVMLRVTAPFKAGDFITVGEVFGKVSARGLFDTEIQTENRELIAIPNATFIRESVTVARRSGVIVSTTLSLGYDVSVAEAEQAMLEAAEAAGLTDPYVHIVGLGDFAVSYRVCGLLTELESILTVRSGLNHQLLAKLHGAGIEIASPSITRHITHPPEHRIMPSANTEPEQNSKVVAEDIVFDKATEIAGIEQQREELERRIKELREAKAESEAIAGLLEELGQVEKALQELGAQTD